MTNKVRFNDNVEVYIYDKDEPSTDIKDGVSLYDKWSSYLFGILLILFIIYVLF